MEVACPSCGAKHRSEDYPGAFDILCSCGYLILNPELGGESVKDEINFEGVPAVAEESQAANVIQVYQEEEEIPQIPTEDPETPFTSEMLTPPEELPEGMLYDPEEVPQFKTEPESNEPTSLTKILIEKVQKASIGQILGPDYNLEITGLDDEGARNSQEKIDKFLEDHKWLKEEMEKRSFLLEKLFKQEKLYKVPEALAVEIYIACVENKGKCLFIQDSPLQNNPDKSF